MAEGIPHKAEVYEDRNGQWRWRLRAHNGHIVADGAEGYTSKGNARRGVERVIKVIQEGKVVVVEISSPPLS